MSTQTQRAAERTRLHRKAFERYLAWKNRPRAPRGLKSLRNHNKTPFASLPEQWRPVAAKELERLIQRYRSRTGREPSQQKIASLHGCAASIVICHRIRQAGGPTSNWSSFNARAHAYRRYARTLGREANSDIRTAAGTETPPEPYVTDPPKVIPFRRRSSWNLRGV